MRAFPQQLMSHSPQILSSGYASHLNTLRSGHEATRRAQSSARIIIHKACFGLPTKAPPHLRRSLSSKKTQAKRTASCPASAAPSPALLEAPAGPSGSGAAESPTLGSTSHSRLRGLTPRLKLR